MQNNRSVNECCVFLNNVNFKSVCIQTVKNRFLENGIITSGFLLAFVLSLLNSLTSTMDLHRHTMCGTPKRQEKTCMALIWSDVCAARPGSTSPAAALSPGVSEGGFALPLHHLGAHLEKAVTGSSQHGLAKGQPRLADPTAFGDKRALRMRGEQGTSFTLNLAKASLSPTTLSYPS